MCSYIHKYKSIQNKYFNMLSLNFIKLTIPDKFISQHTYKEYVTIHKIKISSPHETTMFSSKLIIMTQNVICMST